MSIPSLSLEGQVALVTGARRGIGEACALILAEAGADVAICDWRTDTGELDTVAGKIEGLGKRALAMNADVKDRAQVDAMVQKTMEKFGRIDILVNNAGIGDGGVSTEPENYDPEMAQTFFQERMALLERSSMIVNLDDSIWTTVIENNLKSCLLCSKAVAGIMMEQKKGNIISISSVRGYPQGRDCMAAYSISKRGMIMLTEGLAGDLGKFNIRVNAIAPGGIETEMMRVFWSNPERLKPLTDRMPLCEDKLISPYSIANAALYLASDLSEYVTGQTITVDAGLMVTPARQLL